MLTTNINIADRLINGQMRIVVRIDVNKFTQKPTVKSTITIWKQILEYVMNMPD